MAAIDPTDPTDAEMLTAVNAAIYALVISKFKSTTVNDRTYTRQDLGSLREMKKALEDVVNISANTAGAIRLGDFNC